MYKTQNGNHESAAKHSLLTKWLLQPRSGRMRIGTPVPFPAEQKVGTAALTVDNDSIKDSENV